MTTEKISISELIDNPKNTRIHTQRQIAEFIKSIKMFGVVRPIVVDENNMILIGHGLKMALVEMGETEADVYRITGLSETQKGKLLLSDNKIYSLGVDDFDAIEALIKDLQDFEIPGYDPENLEMMYGQSSLVEDSANFKQSEKEISTRMEQQKEVHNVPTSEIPVSKNVEEARRNATEEAQENRRYVVCPHCGGKIYVE